MTDAKALLVRVAADVIAAQSELNELDGVAGDGDLGVTAAKAARAVREVAASAGDIPLRDLLRECALAVAREAPSTSGTLVASALLSASQAVPAEPAGPVTVAVALAEAAQAGIERRGRAKPGDRTMLDALAPANAALRRGLEEGAPVGRLAEEVAKAARAGAVTTSRMTAKLGRAGWLAERAQGHEDAGARMVALIFESIARHVDGPGRTAQ